MLCILRFEPSLHADTIAGWIIATDVPDACRQAHAAGLTDLATELYRLEFTPPAGKYTLHTDGCLMLVS